MSSAFSYPIPHLPHAAHLGAGKDYSPSTKSADISRLLDPSYASSSTSSFPYSQSKAYVDPAGELHDPDYKHFPTIAVHSQLHGSTDGTRQRQKHQRRRRASSSLSGDPFIPSYSFNRSHTPTLTHTHAQSRVLPTTAIDADAENEADSDIDIDVEDDDSSDLEGLSYPSPTHIRLGQRQAPTQIPLSRPSPASPHFPTSNEGGSGGSPCSSYDSADDGWFSDSHVKDKDGFRSDASIQQRLKKPRRLSKDKPRTSLDSPSYSPYISLVSPPPSSTDPKERCPIHHIHQCLCRQTSSSPTPGPIQVLGDEEAQQKRAGEETPSCLDTIKKEWQSIVLAFGLGMVNLNRRWRGRGRSASESASTGYGSSGWGSNANGRGRGKSFSSAFSGPTSTW